MNRTVRDNQTQVTRARTRGRDHGPRELHILQENKSTLVAATGNDVTRDKWFWHRHGLDILWMLHERGPTCLPQNELLTCLWSRAGHQRSARWAGPSHADATVNRVVVWHVSKFAEAEGQVNVKLLLSANPGQYCSPLHSVQANLSVVSQLLKSATALRDARGQEHTCRRQGNSVSRGKWLWHRHGQDILRKLHEWGPACLPQIDLLTCHNGHVRVTNGRHGGWALRTRTDR